MALVGFVLSIFASLNIVDIILFRPLNILTWPAYADVRIVLGVRRTQLCCYRSRCFVLNLSKVRERSEPARKSGRRPDLLAALRRDLCAEPLPQCWRSLANGFKLVRPKNLGKNPHQNANLSQLLRLNSHVHGFTGPVNDVQPESKTETASPLFPHLLF